MDKKSKAIAKALNTLMVAPVAPVADGIPLRTADAATNLFQAIAANNRSGKFGEHRTATTTGSLSEAWRQAAKRVLSTHGGEVTLHGGLDGNHSSVTVPGSTALCIAAFEPLFDLVCTVSSQAITTPKPGKARSVLQGLTASCESNVPRWTEHRSRFLKAASDAAADSESYGRIQQATDALGAYMCTQITHATEQCIGMINTDLGSSFTAVQEGVGIEDLIEKNELTEAVRGNVLDVLDNEASKTFKKALGHTSRCGIFQRTFYHH